jgi:hydrogenase nickel incorporation protein HypB
LQIQIYENILKSNDYLAEENQTLFNKKNIFAVGILGSPGAGKTSLLEKSVAELGKNNLRPAVLVGDLATSRDAERLQQYDIQCAQITTGGACHLEAQQVNKALKDFDLSQIDILFIENVGNLVCPTGFKLGEHLRTVVFSVPEGDEKVIKYPGTFQKADCIILNKIDYLENQEFDVEKPKREALTLNPNIVWLNCSCRTGQGIDEWINYLKISKEKQFNENN